MIKLVLASFLLSSIVVSGCSKNSSHLPSILDLPSAVGSVMDNASYNAKRKKVSSYVKNHYLSIRNDVVKGGGKSLDGAFDVAGIKRSKRAKAKNRILQSQKETFYNALVVSDTLINPFATLYVNQSTAKDKRINGFSYLEARMIIQNFASTNFEILRLAIQQGQGKGLDELLLKLNIIDIAKQKSFRKKAKELYQTIYLEPVVVAIMVNS